MKKLLFALFLLLFATNCFAQELTKVSGKEVYKTTLGQEADEVIIGDPKSASFVPQITFTKWNKENTLTLKPIGIDLADATPTLSDKLEIRKDKIGWYANPADGDNFKFGIIFYEKPTTNTWSFQLEGWEDLDFFYQAPLKNINPDGSTWEEDIFDGEVIGRSERPANVSGSWAVYHKTKRDHEIGKINYKIGKFGHIYNILFTDADGKSIRIIPEISNGIYTITCPQDFLDTAKYPIKANDTFGDIDGGETGITHSALLLKGFMGFSPSSNGDVTSISMVINYALGDEDFTMGIYDVSSGNPVNLLKDTGGGLADPDIDDYQTQNLDSSLAVTSGTAYALAQHCNDGTPIAYELDTVANFELDYKSSVAYTSGTLTSTFGTLSGTLTNRRYAIYATYTPSGGATGSLLSNCVINNAVVQ
jgi:hypothetical protein